MGREKICLRLIFKRMGFACLVKEKGKKKTHLYFFNELQPALEIGGIGLANLIQNEMQIWIKTVRKFRHFLFTVRIS